VILNYDASFVPASLIAAELKAAQPASIYVTFADGGTQWTAIAASAVAPPPTPDRITIKARPMYGWSETRRPRAGGASPGAPTEPAIAVRYGIESYFVQEGRGKPLEKLVGEKKLAAVIAVDARGNAAIKGLMIDGKPQYEEPLL
jgi:GDYXXLXY protein